MTVTEVVSDAQFPLRADPDDVPVNPNVTLLRAWRCTPCSIGEALGRQPRWFHRACGGSGE